MPFDPTKPQANTPVDADQMRAQLTGLKDLIDTQAATIAALQAQVNDLQTQINDRATFNDLNNAIAGTANNVNAVGDLGGMTVSDPPTQGEVQAIADKVSEVVNGLHR